jgi:uncharacterized repeat protein (TIGR02543 family)
MLLAIFIGSCQKDDYTGEISGLCPEVVSTDPMDKAVDVVLNKAISVTFNTDMKASTINNTNFVIKQGATVVPGTISPTTNGKVFTFTPSTPLLPFTTYTGTISAAVTDTLKTAMVADYNWSFTSIPQILVSASPATSGTVAGGGEFAQGSVITVTATPNAGFAFSNFTVNNVVVSTSSSYQFTVAGNRTLVANFVPVVPGTFAVILSSNPVAGGTTTGSGAYTVGTNVTVTASPNPGYFFTNFTENGVPVSTSSSYQFIIAGNRNLVANYTAIPASQFAITLSSNPPAGGTTSGSGSFSAGSSRTVTATANTGYTFRNWTENGTIVSTSSSYTFALNNSRNLVANFAINTYTLNVVAVGGTVSKNPNQSTYNHGTSVQLTATPSTGFTFTGWNGDASGSLNPITVVMNSNKNIVANFTAVPVASPLFSSNFGVIGGSAGVTNQGINTIINNGGLGTTAVSTAITGFHDAVDVYTETPLNKGFVTGGIFSAPPPPGTATKFAAATAALAAANAFYLSISPANRPGTVQAQELGGLTIAPGTYRSAAGPFLITNGDLTLDAKGDPNAVFVFQAPTSLTVGIAGPTGAKSVILIGGARAENVYWYVGSAATINGAGGGVMVGTIISTSGITFSTAGNFAQTVLNGRAISLVASVTMVNTTINNP